MLRLGEVKDKVNRHSTKKAPAPFNKPPGEGWPTLLPFGSEVRADKVSYASEQYGERGDVAG